MKSDISIALTTYNGAKYLREQLESIYNQTILPDEVIACDDCSSDETISILDEYKNKFGLKYYVNNVNLGYNKNFEKALSLCSCNYIAISDQDDVWLNNKLEVSLKKLKEIENDKPAMVSTNNYKVNTKLELIETTSYKNKEFINYYDSLFNCLSHGATIVINKKLLDIIIPFPENTNYVYDAYIGFVTSFCGNKYYIPEKLIKHRMHNNNSFHNYKPRFKNKIISKLLQYLKYIKSNKHCGLMPEGSYQLLKLVDKHCVNFIVKERRKLLYDLISIYESNYFKSINMIIKLKEITFEKKIKVLFLSFLNAIINIRQ